MTGIDVLVVALILGWMVRRLLSAPAPSYDDDVLDLEEWEIETPEPTGGNVVRLADFRKGKRHVS